MFLHLTFQEELELPQKADKQANNKQLENEGNEGVCSGDPFHLPHGCVVQTSLLRIPWHLKAQNNSDIFIKKCSV